jgi:hypothetical protein
VRVCSALDVNRFGCNHLITGMPCCKDHDRTSLASEVAP